MPTSVAEFCSACNGYHYRNDSSVTYDFPEDVPGYDDDYDDDDNYGDEGSDYDDDGSDYGDSRVYSYSYKPDPVFFGDPHPPLYLGVEMEVECSSAIGKVARTAHEFLQEAATRPTRARGGTSGRYEIGYMKSDSSLDCGIEIVTHPMSYEWAIENFPWDMLREIREAGAYVQSGNCGMHVHASRAGFLSARHKLAWMRFVYAHPREVSKLAGRTSSRWATFNRDDPLELVHAAKGEFDNGQRYRAINPQNYETFEVRCFAATLKPHKAKARLAFVDASIQYAAGLRSHDIITKTGGTWEDFTKFVRKEDKYEPLASYLTTVGL